MRWTPSVDWVIARRAVDGGLRVNRQKAELVQLRKLSLNNGRLGRRRRLRPWESLELAHTETCEQRRELGQRGRVTPDLQRLVPLYDRQHMTNRVLHDVLTDCLSEIP